ncbi:hypothetical protein [Desulfosoma caldarium]|uniref:Uncharacterized protein n=1 Tax=Desulfosoma caldarium TaxID=610254 RepID=A0A3N1UNS8_9BACT|nr:hypothetical protein [Desulfosoma caldarium]ROQ89531.1 hypothetical protein EDC27_3067 [Desulfosoma caldarium]
MMPEMPTAQECRGRFVLIVGDVNRGKTTLTARLLHAYTHTFPEPVAVVDLAPRIPHASPHPAFRPGIGGRLVPIDSQRAFYFSTELTAPRLQAFTVEERWKLAEENAQRIESLFAQVLEAHVPAVFVNDVSLYVQGRPAENLLAWLNGFSTRVVNGYYGCTLGLDAFSLQERRRMEQLMRRCDLLVRL